MYLTISHTHVYFGHFHPHSLLSFFQTSSSLEGSLTWFSCLCSVWGAIDLSLISVIRVACMSRAGSCSNTPPKKKSLPLSPVLTELPFFSFNHFLLVMVPLNG